MPPYGTTDAAERSGRIGFRWTLLVLLCALVLLNLSPTYQDGLAGGIRSTVLRPFLAVQEGLVRARVRSEANEILQARIDSLTGMVVGRTTLEEENRRLRGLLELEDRLGPRWRPVLVLRPGTPDSESMLIVDAGIDEGVRRRAPLITREGLVGVIREASSDQAVGMDWTHADFRASAMTVDGLHYGLVRSSAGLFREDSRLIFDGLPYHARIDPGAVVVTSGLGGVFPRGIPIGRVLQVEDSAAEWRKSYGLEPFVEVGSVTVALLGLAGLEPQDDITAAWAGEPLLRADERAMRLEALVDSVRMLRDSLARVSGAGEENGGESGGRPGSVSRPEPGAGGLP